MLRCDMTSRQPCPVCGRPLPAERSSQALCISQDEQRQAMELLGQGLSYRQIGLELGRSAAGVWYAIRRARQAA